MFSASIGLECRLCSALCQAWTCSLLTCRVKSSACTSRTGRQCSVSQVKGSSIGWLACKIRKHGLSLIRKHSLSLIQHTELKLPTQQNCNCACCMHTHEARLESCVCSTDLEVSVTEPEQQLAIDAVVHKLLAVLAQAYAVRPVTHLSHSPMVHIVLHGLLHCCLQPGPASLQSHTHAAFATAKTHMLLSQQQKDTCCFHDSKHYLVCLQQVTAHLRHESSDRFAAVMRRRC